MNEESRHIVNEDLVAKFFAQETSEEENALILQWRMDSAANQRQFDVWRLVWADTGQIRVWDDGARYDVEFALGKVRRRKEEIINDGLTDSPGLGWVWRVAAIVVMGMGIGWFVWSTQEADVQELVAEADVLVSELDDGSVISLNEGSRLQVTQVSDTRREVFLEGEAYFEVEPDPVRPFVVRTDRVAVEVLGTSFNVSEKSESLTLVSVEEGRVRLSIEAKELILVGGQTGSYDHETGDLKLLEIEDTGEYRFWKTKKLVFRELSLTEIVSTLNRTYDAQIRIANDTIGDCQLTVSFDNESIDNILDVISITLGLEVIRGDDEIVIDGEGC